MKDVRALLLELLQLLQVYNLWIDVAPHRSG